MHIKYENIREEVIQRVPEGWDSVTELLYQFYSSMEVDASGPVREAYRILEDCTRVLPFKEADKICSAANRMCVEYEQAAFVEGMLVGAKVILDLMA